MAESEVSLLPRKSRKVIINYSADPFLNIPDILRMSGLKVYPVVYRLFATEIPQVPLAGRLSSFQKNRKVLTHDPAILSVVEGYEIPFLNEPLQGKHTSASMNAEQVNLIRQEVQGMLRKGAIHKVAHHPKQFLSHLFLVDKKDGGKRPVINLKQLNSYIPYQHFKMEGLHLLKELLQSNDYLCKLDLKDAYFCIPMSQKSRRFLRFLWEGNLYEFLCMCFGLGPAPLIFTKLMKIPISLFRRINIRVIVFLDDMLLMSQTIELIEMARDTTTFLLQNLGFVVNQKKSQMTPVKQIEFLGITVDSETMTLALPQGKVDQIVGRCEEFLKHPEITILDLTKLIGKLSFAAQAVVPARLQHRFLQVQQNKELAKGLSYNTKIVLNKQSLQEISWWKENLTLHNGRPLQIVPTECLIQTDASTTGWGAHCQGVSTGGTWSLQERKKPHKCAGNDRHKISPVHFHKDEESEVNSLSDRQYGGSKLSSEDGGSSQPGAVTTSKRDMGLSVHQPDHDYCRISPQSLECEGRLGVSQSLGLKRVETRPSNLQEDHCQVRNARHRSVCLEAVTSAASLHGLETRPGEQSNRCYASGLEKLFPLCISSVFTDRPGSREGTEGTNTNFACNPSMAIPAMVLDAPAYISRKPTSSTSNCNIIEKSNEGNTSFSKKQKTKVSGVDALREKFGSKRPIRGSCHAYHK